MKVVTLFILLILGVTYSHAQNYNSSLFAGDYTYIEFIVSKKDRYPIVFAAITNKDSIKINLSNVDAFVASVFSSCENSSISDDAYHKTFEMIYGKSEQIFNSCSLFISDFNNKFKKLENISKVTLLTGERVSISYFNIIGVFFRLGQDFLPETFTSIGLPIENTPPNTVIPISIADSYCTRNFSIDF